MRRVSLAFKKVTSPRAQLCFFPKTETKMDKKMIRISIYSLNRKQGKQLPLCCLSQQCTVTLELFNR